MILLRSKRALNLLVVLRRSPTHFDKLIEIRQNRTKAHMFALRSANGYLAPWQLPP